MALNTFILEVTDHKGKVTIHGCGVGGAPGVTAERVAKHLVDIDHFRGKAKSIKILHRSAILKGNMADIVKDIKKNQPPRLTLDDVTIHKDANSLHSDPDNPPPTPSASQAAAAPAVETVSSPENTAAPVVTIDSSTNEQ